MLLSQYARADGSPQVVARDGTEAYEVRTDLGLRALALDCIAQGQSLRERIATLGLNGAVDLEDLDAAGRLLPPVTHPDPAHLHLTGSAPGPAAGAGWFHRGNGSALVSPGAPLVAPGFAADGAEAPGIAGIYLVAPDGAPVRLGWTLASAFPDPAGEGRPGRAHAALGHVAIGPELLIGPLPDRVEGTSRLRRGGAAIFRTLFLTGAAPLGHNLSSLERHHFGYALFRQPGDVHVHMFATPAPSFAEGVQIRDGDVVEVEAPAFGLPLRTPLRFVPLGRAEPPRPEIRAL